MGLLSSLGLPELATLPSRAAAGKPVSAPTVNATGLPAGKPVGPVVDKKNLPSIEAGPLVMEDNLPIPQRTKTIARIEPDDAPGIEPSPSADVEPAQPVAAEADVAADTVADPALPGPTTKEVGYGDFSLGLKESADGASLIVKYEHKQTVAAQNFKVWVIPFYVKADLKIGIEGEIAIKGKGDRQVNVKSGGALELGLGGTSDAVTAGPYSEVALTASTKVPTRLSEAREIAMNPFVVNIYGSGKIGIKFELKNSWSRNSECELANWHLFVVHVGACQNGVFSSFRVEPGKDMQRLFAALQQVGPAIADAVEKYAPDAVKEVAEDGAKWVAESEDAKTIADATGKVLGTVKEQTGVDVGHGAEKVVQFLVDPGGETSRETDRRLAKERAGFDASHGEFQEVIQSSGLNTEWNNPLYRSAEEYNKIHAAFEAGGDWRPMVAALVDRCRAKKAAILAAQAEKKRREKSDADAAAAAELARRVKAAEAELAQALKGANEIGIPLRAITIESPESAAFKGWQECMNSFWSPGTKAALAVKGLQGEARIAKAKQATGLLVQARSGFQQARSKIQ